MFSLTVSAFEGPLDALLGCVERGELDVAGVPVSAIVQQYLVYRAGEGGPATETAEFLNVATRLMLIKSRALLPRPAPPPEREEEPQYLEAVLEEYRRFKDAAGLLRQREEDELRSFPRLAPPPPVAPGPGLSEVTLQRLARIVQDVLARQVKAPAGVVLRETVTIRKKVEQLEGWLTREGRISFTAFISESRSRVEVVVGFMAVLELIRRGRAVAEQPAPFGDIYITVPSQPAATRPNPPAPFPRREGGDDG